MARKTAPHALEPEMDRSLRVQLLLPEHVADMVQKICRVTGERPADALKRLIHIAAPEELHRMTRRAA
ncbi:MAG: hypothetical protein WAS25_06260 [Geothrix sp.]|uniref:hypothetical protein n=1 Tax=Geothrix sp. TaxID=1962974 RepID=UPI003BB1181E|nr:hypothetical protein [Geothrix sp.]